MKAVRHIARAAGSTSATTRAYRVDIRVGGHELIADEPAEQRQRLADIAERTPVTLAIQGGTPITTTVTARNDLT